jgi:hypothetical protein
VPALRWADAGNEAHGFSLINESKYGYDDKGNVLRLSLLRSPTWPDPDADRGRHHFSYALYPHADTWKEAFTVRRGYEFNYKLQATQVEAHVGVLPSEHSFVQVDSQNVVLTALKKSEDGDGLILRFYEWAGQNGKREVVGARRSGFGRDYRSDGERGGNSAGDQFRSTDTGSGSSLRNCLGEIELPASGAVTCAARLSVIFSPRSRAWVFHLRLICRRSREDR